MGIVSAFDPDYRFSPSGPWDTLKAVYGLAQRGEWSAVDTIGRQRRPWTGGEGGLTVRDAAKRLHQLTGEYSIWERARALAGSFPAPWQPMRAPGVTDLQLVKQAELEEGGPVGMQLRIVWPSRSLVVDTHERLAQEVWRAVVCGLACSEGKVVGGTVERPAMATLMGAAGPF